jgi:hypothetical protein
VQHIHLLDFTFIKYQIYSGTATGKEKVQGQRIYDIGYRLLTHLLSPCSFSHPACFASSLRKYIDNVFRKCDFLGTKIIKKEVFPPERIMTEDIYAGE